MGRWDFEVTTLTGSKPSGYGFLDLRRLEARTITLPFKGDPVFTFTMPLDHARAGALLNGDCLLKGYRTDSAGTRRLKFVTEPWTGEEAGSGTGGTIPIVCAGPIAARLDTRLIGTSVNAQGHGVGFAFGTPLALQDLSAIGGAIIDTANGVSPTGVSKGTVTSTGTTSYYERVYFKQAGQALLELSAVLGSFEPKVVPLEPSGATYALTTIARIDLLPTVGTDKPNVIFEYGIGKRNALNYRRPWDRSRIATKTWHNPPGFPDGNEANSAPVSATDATAVAARGLREALVEGDLAVLAMRQGLVNAHLAVRAVMRQQHFITPDPARSWPSTPDYDRDYVEGDTMRVRAYVPGVGWRFNGTVRCYSASFTLGDQGQEAIELGLVPE